MDTQNSQKKSTRGSVKSERKSVDMGSQTPFEPSGQDREKHMDYSSDHVARVRAAKEAAIREMEAFGDPSEYQVIPLTLRPQNKSNDPREEER